MMNKIEQLIQDLSITEKSSMQERDYEEINNPNIASFADKIGIHCNVDELDEYFRWVNSFCYLWTGSPNAGKSTMVLFMFLLMSLKRGYKWCIWSPEMYDAIKGKTVIYHPKDLVNTLIWTLSGNTPFKHYAEKHGTKHIDKDEYMTLMNWVHDHFKFIHMNNRTPSRVLKAFSEVHEKYGVNGFLLDPWKSVKQVMDMRSDLWLEDVLMSFKEFAIETDTLMNYVVHPKALQQYRDADGNFRVITPFDLNGGAAWFNSMDMIVSLRRLESNTEWYTWKARKQHISGKMGSFYNISFDMNTYRFLFNGKDYFCNYGF